MTAKDRLTTALADRYRLERRRGGGMATVYRAQDPKHDGRWWCARIAASGWT
jgi:hypothetical protein